MRIRNAIKYQICDLRLGVAIYYFVMICLIVFGFISVCFFEEYAEAKTFMLSSTEVSSAIFILVVGLNTFKDNFRMFLQNGISRRTMFFSSLAALAALSFFMALAGEALSCIGYGFSSLTDGFEYSNLYTMIYGSKTGILPVLESILINSFIYFAMCLIGFFITTAYYRMNKALKLIVSIGIPAFFMLLLPILDFGLFHGALSKGLEKIIFHFVTGILKSPYVLIAIAMGIIIVLGGLSWLLIRKAISR